jgi:hypothetical protein
MEIPDYVDELPTISGYEDFVAEAMGRPGPFYLPESGVDFHRIKSGFACALHMHQPLIPAGGADLRTAEVISNLQSMMEGDNDGDRYNATIFRDCYKRMAEIIPALLAEGNRPRIMLDYSGELLHGLIKMGQTEVIDALRQLTCDTRYRSSVEWLATAWGHAVAPSTPVQDFRLHVQAWQQFFAALFGAEALSRVRGFSPSEMALPNHPDVAYEFVKTLKDCGFRWVLVQEHTIENVGDSGFDPHVPHRLVARNSAGDIASIIAIVKTQGSDTKLVAQMQPYYEALGLSRRNMAGRPIPPIVTQIADGENGGVMMNEFPSKYREAMGEASDGTTPPLNVTEYLEYLETLGVTEKNLAAVQPIGQRRIWERFTDGAGPDALEDCIQELQREDDRFHMEGGSWTNNISWVHGYEQVLGPMQKVSARFAEKILAQNIPSHDPRYREGLYYLMLTQTSCFRYWGEGIWTDYARELCRRTMDVLDRV